MKIETSIPDEVFWAVESLANRLGITKGEFFAGRFRITSKAVRRRFKIAAQPMILCRTLWMQFIHMRSQGLTMYWLKCNGRRCPEKSGNAARRNMVGVVA